MRLESKTIAFFVLEFIVVFVSLIASFAFEEWREKNELEEKKMEILQSILANIESEQYITNFMDSVISRNIIIFDSVINGHSPQAMNLFSAIKFRFLVTSETIGGGRPQWESLVKGNSSDMARIRNLVKNQDIIWGVGAYLIFFKKAADRTGSSFFANESKGIFDNNILRDLNKSTSESVRMLSEGDFMGDLKIGSVQLLGDYNKLIRNQRFIKAIQLSNLNDKRVLISLNRMQTVLDRLEQDLMEEIEEK